MAPKYKCRHRKVYKDIPIEVKANTITDLNDNMRLRLFGQLYLETYKSTTVSASWYADLERILDKIVDSIGNKPIGKIKPLEVQKFLNSLTDLSSSYINKIYDFTRQLWHHAYANGVTPYDFTLNFEKLHGKKGKNERSLTGQERDVLLKVLDGYITEDSYKNDYAPPRNPMQHRTHLFCKLMLYCGLRPGEVAALVWKDIDLNSEIVSVNKAKKKDETIGDPKSNAGYRDIPIPAGFVPELKKYKRNPFELVCAQLNGSRHTKDSIKKMWKNIRRLMNIGMGCKVERNKLIEPFPLAKDLRLYDLRHTYCTDLEKMEVPINIACDLMGHSDISITSKIYTHASKESLEIARQRINKKEAINT